MPVELLIPPPWQPVILFNPLFAALLRPLGGGASVPLVPLRATWGQTGAIRVEAHGHVDGWGRCQGDAVIIGCASLASRVSDLLASPSPSFRVPAKPALPVQDYRIFSLRYHPQLFLKLDFQFSEGKKCTLIGLPLH